MSSRGGSDLRIDESHNLPPSDVEEIVPDQEAPNMVIVPDDATDFNQIRLN